MGFDVLERALLLDISRVIEKLIFESFRVEVKIQKRFFGN
jgi:hypothetical protein